MQRPRRRATPRRHRAGLPRGACLLPLLRAQQAAHMVGAERRPGARRQAACLGTRRWTWQSSLIARPLSRTAPARQSHISHHDPAKPEPRRRGQALFRTGWARDGSDLPAERQSGGQADPAGYSWRGRRGAWLVVGFSPYRLRPQPALDRRAAGAVQPSSITSRASGSTAASATRSVEKSANAGLPPTYTCMTCHSQIWTNAALLGPVRDSLANDQPIAWHRDQRSAGLRLFQSQHPHRQGRRLLELPRRGRPACR